MPRKSFDILAYTNRIIIIIIIIIIQRPQESKPRSRSRTNITAVCLSVH